MLTPEEVQHQIDIKVRHIEKEALDLIKMAGGSYPLGEIIEALGCQCKRPSRDYISRAIMNLISNDKIIMGVDRVLLSE